MLLDRRPRYSLRQLFELFAVLWARVFIIDYSRRLRSHVTITHTAVKNRCQFIYLSMPDFTAIFLTRVLNFYCSGFHFSKFVGFCALMTCCSYGFLPRFCVDR